MRITLGDGLFALALALGAAFAFTRFASFMDFYDKVILLCAVPVFAWLGWRWKPLRMYFTAAAALSLLGIWLYFNPAGIAELARGQQKFFLKYFLS